MRGFERLRWSLLLTVGLISLLFQGERLFAVEDFGERGVLAVSAPAILSQPQGMTVNVGQKATFSVIASGVAPLTYQWQRSNYGETAWFNVNSGTGGKTATYKTPAATETYNGKQYRVVVSNSGGKTDSQPAVLTVSGTAVSAAITQQPSNQTVVEGMPATFGVLATGTEPITYKWTKNGVPITGATGSEYVTPPGKLAGSGASFAVTVSNPFGKVTSSAAVLHVITGGPVLIKWPESQTVAVGQTATFKVRSAGTAPLSYQWRQNGQNLVEKISSTYTTPVLTAASDGTRYSAVVSNSMGSVTSGEAVIKVVSAIAPTIITQPVDSAALSGQSVTLSVEAAGSGTLGYQWRRKGTNIAGAVSAQYTIANMSAAKEGYYDVIVTNTAGSITSQAALVSMLLGKASIGRAGGTLEAGGVTLTVPPGALPTATVISLFDGGAVPAQVSANAASRVYMLKGLPEDPRQSIQIRIPVTQTPMDQSVLRIESGGYSEMIPATVDGNFLVATIGQGDSAASVMAAPAAEEVTPGDTAEPAVGGADATGTKIAAETGQGAFLSPGKHFRVWYDKGFVLKCNLIDAYKLLADALDHAYGEYTNTMGLSFSALDFPNDVMDVYIYPFTGAEADMDGVTKLYFFHRPFGQRAMYIAFNQNMLKCGPMLRAVPFHELMHVAATTATTIKREDQAAYPVLSMLQDAAATAAESIGAGNLTYFPDVIVQQNNMAWDGLGVVGSSGQEKGYATAGVFRYLSLQSKYGNTRVLGDIWRNLDKNSVIGTVGLVTELPPTWWHDFAYKYMTYGVYADGGGFDPLTEVNTQSNRKTKAVLPANASEYSHTTGYTPFSAFFYDIDISKATYDSALSSELLLSVEPGDPGTNVRDILRVSLIAFEKTTKSALTPIVNGNPGEPLKVPFSLLNDMKSRHSRLVVMVVAGSIGNPPWTTSRRNIKFKAKLFSPDAWLSTEIVARGIYAYADGSSSDNPVLVSAADAPRCPIISSNPTFSCNWDYYTTNNPPCNIIGSMSGAFNSSHDTLLKFQIEGTVTCPYGDSDTWTRHYLITAADVPRTLPYLYGADDNYCTKIKSVEDTTTWSSRPLWNGSVQSWYCTTGNYLFIMLNSTP